VGGPGRAIFVTEELIRALTPARGTRGLLFNSWEASVQSPLPENEGSRLLADSAPLLITADILRFLNMSLKETNWTLNLWC
jgi:hypothetical protein